MAWDQIEEYGKTLKAEMTKENTDKLKLQQQTGAGEMAHWLKVLAALTEDLSLSSRTHMEDHSHL